MNQELLALLRCPVDQGTFSESPDALVCTKCDHRVPVVGGIPRFVPNDAYVGSFSHQWLTYEDTVIDEPEKEGGYDESERIMRGGFGITPEFVKGKVVLDAGCGSGRHSATFARWGAKVISVDLSRAVEACYRNAGPRGEVLVIQADLINLPIAPESVDLIYSNGVLHHSNDTRAAFKSISRCAKDGAYATIYVYSDYGNNKWLDRWRRYTPTLPTALLHTLSKAAIPAFHLRKIRALSPLATALYKVFPMSTHIDSETRALLTFDLYAPQFRTRHTYPEIQQWFFEEGFEDVKVFETQIIVGGWMRRHGSHPSHLDARASDVPITTDRNDAAYLEGRRGLD